MSEDPKLVLAVLLLVAFYVVLFRFPQLLAPFVRRATARCRNSSLSFSAHACGTCSHHGGVAEWLSPLPA